MTQAQQRMTKQKQLVLGIVQAHHDHPTADQIYLEVRKVDDKISRGTVYRNLSQLSDAGMISHVRVPGADRFDYRLEKHLHMLCTTCGELYDAPMEYQEDLDNQVFEKTGFQVDRHRTIFEGTCPSCLAKIKSNQN